MKKNKKQSRQSDPLKTFLYTRKVLQKTQSTVKAHQDELRKIQTQHNEVTNQIISFLANRVFILQNMNQEYKQVISERLSPQYSEKIAKKYGVESVNNKLISKILDVCMSQSVNAFEHYANQFEDIQPNEQQIPHNKNYIVDYEQQYRDNMRSLYSHVNSQPEPQTKPHKNGNGYKNGIQNDQQIYIEQDDQKEPSIFQLGICEEVQVPHHQRPQNLKTKTPAKRYDLEQNGPSESMVIQDEPQSAKLYHQTRKMVDLDLQNQKKIYKNVRAQQSSLRLNKQLSRMQTTRISRFIHQNLVQHLKFHPDVLKYYVPKKQILNMYFKWVYELKEKVFVTKESSIQMQITNQLKIAFPSMEYYSGNNYRGIYFWKQEENTGNNYKFTASVRPKLEEISTASPAQNQ